MTKLEFVASRWDDVCTRIECGETIRELAKVYDCAVGTFSNVCAAYPELAERYAQARTNSADAFEAEIIEVSRDEVMDVARARLIADTLKWVAGRRHFARYGDRQQVDTKHEIGEGLAERMNKALKRLEDL